MQAVQWIQIHTWLLKTMQILRWYVKEPFGTVVEFMGWIYQLSYSKFWTIVFNGKNHSWENAAFIHMSWWYFACQLPWKALSKTALVTFYGNESKPIIPLFCDYSISGPTAQQSPQLRITQFTWLPVYFVIIFCNWQQIMQNIPLRSSSHLSSL